LSFSIQERKPGKFELIFGRIRPSFSPNRL
jgi:hypothetical protein